MDRCPGPHLPNARDPLAVYRHGSRECSSTVSGRRSTTWAKTGWSAPTGSAEQLEDIVMAALGGTTALAKASTIVMAAVDVLSAAGVSWGAVSLPAPAACPASPAFAAGPEAVVAGCSAGIGVTCTEGMAPALAGWTCGRASTCTDGSCSGAGSTCTSGMACGKGSTPMGWPPW